MNFGAILQWTIIAAIGIAILTNGNTSIGLLKTFSSFWLGETQVLAGNTTLKRAA